MVVARHNLVISKHVTHNSLSVFGFGQSRPKLPTIIVLGALVLRANDIPAALTPNPLPLKPLRRRQTRFSSAQTAALTPNPLPLKPLRRRQTRFSSPRTVS